MKIKVRKLNKVRNDLYYSKNNNNYKDGEFLNQQKAQTLIMAGNGFALKYIAKEVQIPLARVRYFCYSEGIKTTNYRNGKTKNAIVVRNQSRVLAVSLLESKLKEMKLLNNK